MLSQAITDSDTRGAHLTIDQPPSSRLETLELLLEKLVAVLEQQRRLRALDGHWDELAALQETLHELRAGLAIERSGIQVD